MELQIQYSILFTFFFCFLRVILNTVKRSNSKESMKNLPPGPWKLPLIGNLHQFVGSLPHHSLRNLSNKYGPLMFLQLGETSNVVVSSPEIAKEIMKSHDVVFANRPNLLAANVITYNNTDIGFSPYGSYWRQLRKIATLELFTAKRVRSFRLLREEEVSSLIKTIYEKEGSIINLSEEIFSTTNIITARAAFGKKCKDQEAFLSTLKDIMSLVGGFSIADLYPSIKMFPVITGMKTKAERVHRKNDEVLENIIKDHKEKSERNGEEEEDLVDVLLKIQQQNDLEFMLTHNSVKAVISDIFVAGSESSSTVVEWAMSELLKNPKAMEKAQNEVRKVFDHKGFVDETDLHQLKYLNSIIKETLRLHPPGVLLLPRESSKACVINGYNIPPKTKIIVNAWAIGRDSRYWIEAENFCPERFLDNPIDFKGTNFEYIPFGAGRRMCPGIAFAIPNIELPLASVLYHFDWKLPNGISHEEFDMTETFGATVRRRTNLFLIPVRHKP